MRRGACGLSPGAACALEQGATQGLDALKTIPSSVGQQLYSIVNWDTDPR